MISHAFPTSVRLLIKRTPWLYSAHYSLRRFFGASHRLKLCGKGVDLCVEGYPSSGNSFAVTLLRELNPNVRVSSHFHSVANVKLAMRHGIPVVILLREPLETLSSRIVRFGSSPLPAVLDYLDFHRHMNQFASRSRLCFIGFEALTKRTGPTVDRISSFSNLCFPHGDETAMQAVSADVLAKMDEIFMSWGRQHLQRGLPNSEKEQLKKQVKQRLIEMPEWKEVASLYRALEEKADR
ncbi:MAG: hypothetical protein ACK54F_10205 [Planctomycetia bacterium]|jgi:hypothetical protein